MCFSQQQEELYNTHYLHLAKAIWGRQCGYSTYVNWHILGIFLTIIQVSADNTETPTSRVQKHEVRVIHSLLPSPSIESKINSDWVVRIRCDWTDWFLTVINLLSTYFVQSWLLYVDQYPAFLTSHLVNNAYRRIGQSWTLLWAVTSPRESPPFPRLRADNGVRDLSKPWYKHQSAKRRFAQLSVLYRQELLEVCKYGKVWLCLCQRWQIDMA